MKFWQRRVSFGARTEINGLESNAPVAKMNRVPASNQVTTLYVFNMNQQKIEKARKFAIDAHGDQKYGELPYHVHLDAVAEIASEYGETAQIIAYLHDVAEDTPVQLNDIESEFGKFVAECVAILSDEPGANRKDRKRKTYSKMANVSGELETALIVKAADRLANMRACVSDNNHKLLKMYKEEHEVFEKSVRRESLCENIWYEINKMVRLAQHNGYNYEFWESPSFGLIRQKSTFKELHNPEIIVNGKWITGNPYVVDAITGMGEDPWSCGEISNELSAEDAEKIAKENKIGLYE